MERSQGTTTFQQYFVIVKVRTFILGLVWLPTIHGDNTVEKLQSGPMIGYATMAEVLIWVQTTGPSEVQISYWRKGDPSTRWKTDVISTKKETAFVAECLATQVQ